MDGDGDEVEDEDGDEKLEIRFPAGRAGDAGGAGRAGGMRRCMQRCGVEFNSLIEERKRECRESLYRRRSGPVRAKGQGKGVFYDGMVC